MQVVFQALGLCHWALFWFKHTNSIRSSLTLLQVAAAKRIARVTCDAHAIRRVTDNVTLSILTADSGTRIPTLLVDASPTYGTLAVTDAFRPTAGRRPDVLRQARARRGISRHFAQGVRATGRGFTRSRHNSGFD